jgi:hypothetical protein
VDRRIAALRGTDDRHDEDEERTSRASARLHRIPLASTTRWVHLFSRRQRDARVGSVEVTLFARSKEETR